MRSALLDLHGCLSLTCTQRPNHESIYVLERSSCISEGMRCAVIVAPFTTSDPTLTVSLRHGKDHGDPLQRHGGKDGKDWTEIVALVPGRTKTQCTNRWHYLLKPSISQTTGRTGEWTGDEDRMLREAVKLHGCKEWVAIIALVPGRTNVQCSSRWKYALNPSIAIARATGRKGAWTEGEDDQLKDAVHMHSGKDWALVAALFSGRTKGQCSSRWYQTLKPTIAIARANGRKGAWTESEDD